MARKLWSKSIGERGARVRIYETRPGGNLMRAVFIDGKEDRKSLGHTDRELAVRQAHELVAALLANESALQQETLTLGLLIELYLESPAHADKKPRTQREDRKRLVRMRTYFGASRVVESLTESDVRRYAHARRTGTCRLPGIEPGRAVGSRAVQADLVALVTALNWGAKERDRRGRRLLAENPLRGIALPTEQNPRRPVMKHDEYLALLEVAEGIQPALAAALVVAEGTGRRISALRQLRWEDVDFAAETIRWRAEHDKRGYEQVMPMSEGVREALLAWRKECPGIGSTWVFPSPKDASKPCDRHLLDSWLRRAYEKAGVEREPGGLWHAIRRKWATERKGYPVRDVAAAGGWRDVQTLLRSYQQPDEATVRMVVLQPSHRLVAAGPARETHNKTHNSGRKQPRPRNGNSLQGLRLV